MPRVRRPEDGVEPPLLLKRDARRPREERAAREIMGIAVAILRRDRGEDSVQRRDADEATSPLRITRYLVGGCVSPCAFSDVSSGVWSDPYSRQTALSGVNPPADAAWK